MSPIFRLICFIGINLSLTSHLEAKDFCIGFRENGDKIGYTYRRFYGQQIKQIPDFYIIINGFYWRLNFDSKSNEEKTLAFAYPKLGTKSQFFSGDYFMASCIRTSTEGWKEGRAALFSKKDWNKVFVGDIPGDEFKEPQELEAYESKATLEMSTYFGQSFVFDDSVDMKGGSCKEWCHKLVLISQYDEKGQLSEEWHPYRFFVYANQTHLRLSPDKSRTEYLSDYQAIRDIGTNEVLKSYSLVGIVPQKTTESGFILLFKDGMKIKWCWTKSKGLDAKCTNGAEVLIDCFGTELTVKSSPILMILSICFVIILLIVIGSAVFLFVANRRAQKGKGFGKSRSKSSTTLSKTTSSTKPKVKSPVGVKPPLSPKPPGAPKSTTPPKQTGAKSSGAKPSGATPPKTVPLTIKPKT